MFLMTVSSAPLALVHEKQAKNYVALFQNKTLLSELAEADPEVLNTILGLLEGLLGESLALSLKYTTDVENALGDKNAASAALADAVIDQTTANDDKTAAAAVLSGTVVDVGTADRLVEESTTALSDAMDHHAAKVSELEDKQPGVNAESDTLRDTIALIQTLLPGLDPLSCATMSECQKCATVAFDLGLDSTGQACDSCNCGDKWGSQCGCAHCEISVSDYCSPQ